MIETVGIFGGTFNPVHIGHLIAAQEVLKAYCLDRIVFIPNRTPPHRNKSGVIDGKHRLEMLDLAIGSNPDFHLSRVELDRTGPSYTLYTVQLLKQLNPKTKYYFTAGADSLVKDTWYKLDSLLGTLEGFIVISRPGFIRKEVEDRIKQLNLENKNRISFLKIPDIEISASMIRARLKKRRNIKYLVPEKVESYIYENNLYM